MVSLSAVNAITHAAYSNTIMYNYTRVSTHVHLTCTSCVLYIYLYCVYVLVKEMMA